MTDGMDRGRLAAFVDGELSPEEAAAVVMHLANHSADQAYVDDLFAANAALSAAFDAPMREPVPERLLRVIDGPAMVAVWPFRRRVKAVGGAVALAASLASVAVMIPRDTGVDLAVGPVLPEDALARLLDTLPSGRVHSTKGEGEVMVLATMPTPDGHCREIEVIDREAGEIALALTCRAAGGGWTVEVVLSEPLSAVETEDGFVPADGAEMQGLSVFLDGKKAGPALSAAEEADLIGRGWAE